ncbi:MAG: hypothetical protein KBC81_03645 [Candidatus Pacebacteria bacterium]|nr:hypothetical protein [Candidatus Paceibacterota bacterium]
MPNPKYRNIKFTEGTSTQYVIRFHIEGVEYPFHRVRYVYDHGSIAAAIKHLVKWHGETSWGGPRGRALKIDAVVKVSSYYHEVSQVGMQHIEAYEFPKDFDLKKFEGEVAA